MLRGQRFTFDAESAALYDAVAPTHTEQEFEGVLRELDQRLPGDGTLLERYEAFRDRFAIRKDRLAAVFAAAIDGCRSRTLAHITLPAGESFTIEYVTDKSWRATTGRATIAVDPTQHRSADLHRSRDRSRVP
jgi:hypothetical protein